MSEEELRAILGSLAKTVKEIGEEHKKTEAAQQKTEAALASLVEEHKKTEAAQQKTEAALASLVEEHKKTEAALASLVEERKKTEAAQQKTEAAIRELHKELGGVGRTQGEIAEDLFRRNLKPALKQRGIQIDKVGSNWRLPDAEFDLIGENGTHVFLVEVKSRLQASDIDLFLSKQIPAFRTYFQQYKDHKLMGGLASLAVGEKLEKQIEKAGLFLFTQTETDGACIVNSLAFSPKVFA